MQENHGENQECTNYLRPFDSSKAMIEKVFGYLREKLRKEGKQAEEQRLNKLFFEICPHSLPPNTLSRILKLMQCDINDFFIDQAGYDKVKAEYEDHMCR